MIELAPSLLAADLMRLGGEIEDAVESGVRILHLDIMDAHFVPNLSFGPAFCQAIRERFPELFLDVHLMMDDPEDYIGVFRDAGASALTLHREVLEDADKALRAIGNARMKRGLALKPGTGADALYPYLDRLDHILIMTVEPGFGGQKFMPEQMEKIRLLREKGFKGTIGVDGGVNLDNAEALCRAGASILVMGTAFFKAGDRKEAVRRIRELT